MYSNEELYKQKYLKYKMKYLELQNQQGGITTKTGVHIVFFNRSEAEYLSKQLKITDYDTIMKKIGYKEYIISNSDFLNISNMKKLFGFNGVFLKNQSDNSEAINKTSKLITLFNNFLKKQIDKKETIKPEQKDKVKSRLDEINNKKNNLKVKLFDFHKYSTHNNLIEFVKTQALKKYLQEIITELNKNGYNIDTAFIVNINKINKNKYLGYFKFDEIKLTFPTEEKSKGIFNLLKEFINSISTTDVTNINNDLEANVTQIGGLLFDFIAKPMIEHEVAGKIKSYTIFPIWFPLLIVYFGIYIGTIGHFDLNIFFGYICPEPCNEECYRKSITLSAYNMCVGNMGTK